MSKGLYKKKLFEHLNKNKDCSYVNDIYVLTKNENFLKLSSQQLNIIGVNALLILSIVISGILLIINLLYKQKIDYNSEIAIARVSREKNKIENVISGLYYIGDDIKNRDFTIYRVGNRVDRLLFIFKSYVKFCRRDFNRIKELLIDEQLFPNRINVMLWCVKRIPHTIIYRNAIENIMLNYQLTNIYIGATHSRFALIAAELAKKNNKKLVCIPHGVETTEKMPAGYIGDTFYCSSIEMATKLNQLYDTTKFIFDNKIMRQMYCIKDADTIKKLNREKRVVFFTQPIYIKQSKYIIAYIAKHLESKNQKLYIKVHPNENPSEYIFKNTELITDFKDSIIGNMCISVLSTVLLEAIYNDSFSISIIHLVSNTSELVGDSEFLKDRYILKPKDDKELIELIDNIKK